MDEKVIELWNLLNKKYDGIPEYDVFKNDILSKPDVSSAVRKLMINAYGEEETRKYDDIFNPSVKKKENGVSGSAASSSASQSEPTASANESGVSPRVAVPKKLYKEQDRRTRAKIREFNSLYASLAAEFGDADKAEQWEQVSPIRVFPAGVAEQIKETNKSERQYKWNKLNTIWNNLKAEGVVDGEMRWIENDPARGMSGVEYAATRANAVLEEAFSSSIIGKLLKFVPTNPYEVAIFVSEVATGETLIDDSAMQDFRQYNNSQLEQYLSTGLSFAIDIPLFMGLGALTAPLRFTTAATQTVARGLIAGGVMPEMASQIAIRSLSNTAKGLALKAAESSVKTGFVLGSYGALHSTLEQIEQKHLDEFSAIDVLSTGGKDFLIGAGVGLFNPLWAKFGDMASAGIENQMMRRIAKAGVRVGEFANEATVFAGLGAALNENQTFGTDELVQSALMLLTIKAANAIPNNLIGKVRKINRDVKVQLEANELRMLNVKNENELGKLSQEQLVEIVKNPEIPLMTKYKMFANLNGILPVGTIKADEVEVNEGVVRMYRQYNGNRELLLEREFGSKQEATSYALRERQAIEDRRYKERVGDFNVEQLKVYEEKLSEVDGKDAMLDAVDTPVELRTPEQVRLAKRWRNMVDEIDGLKELKTKTDVELKSEKGAINEKTKPVAEEKPDMQSAEVKADKKGVVEAEKVKSEEKPMATPEGEAAKTLDVKARQAVKPEQVEVKPEKVELKEDVKQPEKGQKEAEISTKTPETIDNIPKPEKSEIKASNEVGQKTVFDEIKSVIDEWKRKEDAKEVRRDERQVLSGVPEKGLPEEGSVSPSEGKGSPDIQQPAETGRPEVAFRERIAELIKSKRGSLANLDDRLILHFVEEVNNAKPEKANEVLARLERLSGNSDYAGKISNAYERMQRVKDAHRGVDTKKLKGFKFKTKFSEKGDVLDVFVNGVDVTELPENLVDRYISIADGILSKKVSQRGYREVREFLSDYSEAIMDRKILNTAREYNIGTTVESIRQTVESINSDVERLRNEPDPQIVKDVDRKLNATQRLLGQMKRDAILDKDLKVIDGIDAELQRAVDDFVELQATAGGVVTEAKLKEKDRVISGIQERAKGVSLTSKADARELEAIRETLGRLQHGKTGKQRVRDNDLEVLADAVEVAEKTGVLPSDAYVVHERLLRSKLYGDIIENAVEPLEAKMEKDPKLKQQFDKTVNEFRRMLARNPASAMGDLLKLSEQVGGVTDSPFYNYIYNPGRAAIQEYLRAYETLVKPIYENSKTRTWFEKHVYDWGSYDRKRSAMVGILMPQVRMYNKLQDLSGRIVGVDGKYKAVDPFGNEYRDEATNQTKWFNTKEEALGYLKSVGVDRLADGQPFDLFFKLNYEVVNGERTESYKRRNANLHKNEAKQAQDMKIFDDAYAELVRRNKEKNGVDNLSNIKNDEDALALLTPEERKLYEALRRTYKETQDVAEAVAAREGRALRTEEFYTAMLSRSGDYGGKDAESLFVTAMESNRLQVTNHIKEKTLSLNYIDFDAVRVADRYLRDMLQSYYVLPVAKQQLKVLNDIKKVRPNEAIYNAIEKDIRDGYKIQFSSKGTFGELVIGDTKRSIDLTRFLKNSVQAMRNYTLAKAERVVLDGTANMIKAGRLYTGEMVDWDVFFRQHYTGTSAAQGVTDVRFGRNTVVMDSGYERKGGLQKVTDEMVGLGDELPSRRVWVKTFNKSFKELYGFDFDVKEFVSNEEYRLRVKSDPKWERAIGAADSYNEQVLMTSNKFSSAKEISYYLFTLRSDTKAHAFNASMASYNMNESAQFHAALNNVGSSVNTQKVIRFVLSNMAFNYLTQMGLEASKYVAGELSDDENVKYYSLNNMKELHSAEGLIANAGVSLANLAIGRYANIGRLAAGAMYNIMLHELARGKNKYEKYQIEKNVRAIGKNLGVSRVISSDFDPTKDYTRWDLMLSASTGWYGKAALDFGEDLSNLPKEVYNFVLNNTSENPIHNDPFDPIRMLSGLNALASGVVPGSPNIKFATKALTSDYVNVPKEYLSDVSVFKLFTLTYEDAAERYKQKYDQIKNYRGTRDKKDNWGSIRLSTDRQRWEDETDDVMADASLIAGDVVKEYLEADGTLDVYKFYVFNKKFIDIMDDFIRELGTSKTMSAKERKEGYELIRSEAKVLESKFDEYRKGGGESIPAYVPSEEMLRNAIFQRISNKKKELLKKYNKLDFLFDVK